MDVKAATELADYLNQTLCPEPLERKKAEAFIKTVELQPSYSLCLLGIALNDSFGISTRLAAAITFKNFIKAYWRTDLDPIDRISTGDRDNIRNQILGALLSVSGVLQPQLSEAIGLIWREDFPNKWPNLIPELVERMAQLGADLNMVRGVLQTAHTLFKRYRHECAGNDLFREMKTVIGQFGAPLTELAKNLLALVTGEQRLTDGNRLTPVFQCLLLVCKIFLSLNCQDLPEFFEDNINDWMTIFRSLLQLDESVIQLLNTAVSRGTGAEGDGSLADGASLVEQVKSQVCDNMSLYASKYEAEFAPFLSGFVTDVWEMLINTGDHTKHDMLIGNAIEFLSAVIARPQHRHLFQSPETLQKLCEKVIIPNMHFSARDEELFSDNPEEYLRLDLEGSDTHTRRRSACHLVHVLCQAFEGEVVQSFSSYITHLLTEYANSAGGAGWTSKDAALLLVTSVAARGRTEKLGVTVSTELVNIPSFYETHVLPELQHPQVDHLPVIKADCMRYAIAFRSLLPPTAVLGLVNMIPRLLSATTPVVYSYAAALLDKLLSMKQPQQAQPQQAQSLDAPLIPKDQIQDPQLLLESLLSALCRPDATENVYIIRALMRTCCCLQDRCLPSMNSLVSNLLTVFTQVAKNPNKPNFNHFLFETMCLCVRTTCATDAASVMHFEAAFFPVFQEILQNDVSEFVPYVFQLLSVMLEQYPMSETVTAICKSQSATGGQIGTTPQQRPSPPYAALLPRVLVPSLWDQRGNIPALSRLLQSYVLHDMEEIIASNKLSAILGVYQRLIASTFYDVHAFSLLGALILACPKDQLQPLLRQVFIVIFRRLQSSKTEKFMKAFVWLMSRFILVYSPNDLIDLIDGMQPMLFARVLEKVLLPYTEAVISTPMPLAGFGGAKGASNITTARIQWHQVSLGLIRLCTETDRLIQPSTYGDSWAPLVSRIVAGLAAGPGRGGDVAVQAAVASFNRSGTNGQWSRDCEEQFVEIDVDSSSNQAAFGQLTFAVQRVPELCSRIADPRVQLAQALFQLASVHPGRIGPLLGSALDAEGAQRLQSYLALAGVVLP